jgi:ADP-ribosylglycohydrolase
VIGAISGDVIGSVHEGAPAKAKDFPLFVPGSTFTDDTVLTVAAASAIRERVERELEIVRQRVIRMIHEGS